MFCSGSDGVAVGPVASPVVAGNEVEVVPVVAETASLGLAVVLINAAAASVTDAVAVEEGTAFDALGVVATAAGDTAASSIRNWALASTT